MNPHVALTVGMGAILYHLCGRLVSLRDMQFQKLLLHPLHEGFKVLLRTPDDPVSHGLSGDVHSVPLELLLNAMECRGINVLHI